MLTGLLVTLALALVAVTDSARAGRGAAGLVLAALAALSLQTGAGTLEPARLARIGMTAAVPPWFLEASLSLLCVGIGVAVAGSRSWLVGLLGAGVVGALLPVLRTLSMPRFLGLASLLVAGLYTVVLAARAVRSRLGEVPAGEAWLGAALPGATAAATIGVAAAMVALLSPWTWLTFGAAVVAFGSAMALPIARPQRLLLGISLLMVAGAGVAAVWGARAVPGPGAPSADLLDASRSIVTAGLLLLPSSVALAAWPWHRLAPGLVLAPAALALTGRYAAAAAPLGLAWWLPAVFPIVLIGVCAGLLRGHVAGAVTSLSLVGLWIGTPASRAGAAILVIVAMALAIRPASPVARSRHLLGRAGWAVGGTGLVLVLAGGLTVQVVYTTLLAIVTAVGLLLPADVAATRARS